MANPFLTFRRFYNAEEAQELIALLKAHNIPYLTEDASATYDVSFAGNTLEKQVHVKLRQSDFTSTEELLLTEVQVSTDQLPADYYLFGFSDEELMEILMKSDEWSATDFHLAQQLLKQRGKEVTADSIKTLKKSRYAQLAQPEESKKSWIYVGFISSILGGVLGILIGWHLMTFKKTLPDGQRVYNHSPADRKSGEIIFWTGMIFAFLWLLVWLTDPFKRL